MKLITVKETAQKLRISRATLWRLTKEDKSFPKKRQISRSRVAFIESEIDQWIESQFSKMYSSQNQQQEV